MGAKNLLTGLLAIGALVSATPIQERSAQHQLSFSTPEWEFDEASEYEVTQNVVELERLSTSKMGHSSAALHSIRSASPSTPLIPADAAQEYLVSLTFGSQNLKMIFDSGSSDTWVASKGFKCVNVHGAPRPESSCHFGPLGPTSFDAGSIKGENFNISYGDGEFVTGVMGYEDITLAGLKVTKQESALANYAFWEGDGVSSGLTGVAYRSLTSAFKGTNPKNDNPDTNQVEYPPIFAHMYNQKLISQKLFSLAIERGQTKGGYVAFGGLPPVSFDKSKYGQAKIQIAELIPFAKTAKQYSFYTIKPQTVTINKKASAQTQYYIVDSGTTLLYIPNSEAKAVNAAFNPPAKYIPSQGAYFVDCNAKAPSVSITIGGVAFPINAEDLIFKNVKAGGLCLTGVANGDGLNILGDVFLRNVVAAFDAGAGVMKFYEHSTY